MKVDLPEHAIGTSIRAGKYTVVPSKAKEAKSVILSDTEQAQLTFWTDFVTYLERQNSFLEPHKPAALNYITLPIVSSDFRLSALTNRPKQFAAVELEIMAADHIHMFHALAKQKEAIESSVGQTLHWREMPANKRSIISLRRDGIDVSDAN